MRNLFLLLMLLATPAFSAVTITEVIDVDLFKSGVVIQSDYAGMAECDKDARNRENELAMSKFSGKVEYLCRERRRIIATYSADPGTCPPPQPANETRAGTCPAGTTGSWTQTRTYSCPAGATVWKASAWLPATPPAGACITTPPPAGNFGALIGPLLPFNAADPVDVAFTKFAETAIGNYSFEGRTTPCASGGCSPDYQSAWDATFVDLNLEEPWLFDRATTFFKLCAKTGVARWCDHARELAARYYSHVTINGTTAHPRGIFDLSSYNHDLKYSYTDPAVWFEASGGDQRYRPQVQAIYDAGIREWQVGYSPSLAMWTERHHAYAMGAALGHFALFNTPASLDRARQLFETVNTMAAGTGAPLHTVEQHEGDGGDQRMMVSPWMSALLVEYIATYGRLSGDLRVNPYLSRYADFIVQNCLYDGGVEDDELAGKAMPWYLCGRGIFYPDQRGWGDMEHALDVSGVLAHGIAAKRALGQDTTATLTAYNALRNTAQFVFGYWTRPTATLPKYRVVPPRKFNWWFGSTYDNTALISPN